MTAPAKTITWTDRDREILQTLTCSIRLMTLGQAARTWWHPTADPERNARTHLDRLVALGHLERRIINTHPELPLETPACRWQVGDPTPDFESVSYRLKSRWTGQPKPTAIYTATKKAMKRFGGRGGGLTRPLHTTHDLHMTTLYLRLLRDDPETVGDWVGEDKLAGSTPRHEKHPDAVLTDPDGRPYRVVEFGGSYNTERVQKLHLYCEAKKLAYELW